MSKVLTYFGFGLLLFIVLWVGSGWTDPDGKRRPAEESTLISQPKPDRTVEGNLDIPIDASIEHWSEQTRSHPRDTASWNGLGEALVRQGQGRMDVRCYSRAESAFQKALLLEAENTGALGGLAWVAILRRQTREAVRLAGLVLSREPENQRAQMILGDAAMETGDYETAFRHYQKMQDIRPDLLAYSRGARLLFLTGDVRKATWLMQKAIDSGSSNPGELARCRAELALMLWKTGALLPAEQQLQKALKEMPENYWLLLAIGRMKSSRQENTAAIECYQRAIALAPGHEALVALGDLYLQMGEKEKAEEQFSQIEALHRLKRENGVQDQLEMARFYASHDRNLSQALALAEEEYRLRPSIFAADVLAFCYYKVGRYPEARDMIQQAMRLGSPEAGILQHAGMIYEKLGESHQARQYFYRAQSLNPYW